MPFGKSPLNLFSYNGLPGGERLSTTPTVGLPLARRWPSARTPPRKKKWQALCHFTEINSTSKIRVLWVGPARATGLRKPTVVG